MCAPINGAGLIHRTGQTGLVHPSKIVQLEYEDGIEYVEATKDIVEMDKSRLSFKKGDKVYIVSLLCNLFFSILISI